VRWTRVAVPVAILAVVLGLSKAHASYVASPGYDLTDSPRLAWALAFASLLMLGSYVVGLPGLVEGRRSALQASAGAILVAVAAVSSAQLLWGDALLPRFVVFGSVPVLLTVLTALAVADVAGRHRIAQRDSVYFVGGRSEAVQLSRDLQIERERPAVLVGSATIEDLETLPLVERLADCGATLVVLDVVAQGDQAVVAQAALVHEQGVRVRTLSLFYEQWLAKLPVSELERVSLLFDIGELHRARYARVKRLADLVVGSLGLVVLVVAVPLVAIGNVVANRGPMLFRQQRVGKGGAEFTILKFRTMAPGSSDGSWTSESDPRITRFGGLLRRSHLDELPQMVNIVRGDLSLVGPRPEQPRYVEELTEKLPFYRLRHLVRPGLTGWAQVKYGYASDEHDALEKLQYEFYYLRRQGLLLDLRIIGRTARHLVGGGGR
jgi:lipopolysaccharide/colanic/teichoic acid biosynthesis glycosyltransferase